MKIKNFSNYKFRSSEMGDLITKSGKPTQGQLTHIRKKYVEATRGHKDVILSKYFTKGNLTEQEGLRMVNKVFYPRLFVRKNDERFNNEYIAGTPDTIVGNEVWDIKNAWDWSTFHKAHLSWIYEWQVKSYIWLTGAKKGYLFYCLNDAPKSMIDDEERKRFYAGVFPSRDSDDYEAARKELEAEMTYSDAPIEERFKFWEVSLTDEDVDRMKNAVEFGREMMKQLRKEELERIKDNRRIMELNKS